MGAPSRSRSSARQFGRYELLARLATGGMAELHLARLRGHGGFEKLVAIKRILAHHAEDAHFVEMFLNEGRIAARLSHPNICQVYELGDVDGELFMAMEYVAGVPLGTILAALPRNRDGFDVRVTAGILVQASEGVHYAHEHRGADGVAAPIVHRDISPSNLLVTTEGVCKVVDFGISKVLTEVNRTRTGILKGKPAYMAPEQIRAEPFDQRADVFALGVLLWEAVAGRRLFQGDSDFLIWQAITQRPAPRLASVRPDVPAAIDELVERALAKDPRDRPATARAFAAELRRAVAPLGGVVEPPALATYLATLCGDAFAARAALCADALAADGRDLDEPVATRDPGGTGPTASIQLRDHTAQVGAVASPRRMSRRRAAIVLATAAVAGAALAFGIAGRAASSPDPVPVPLPVPDPVAAAPAPAPAPAVPPSAPSPAPTPAPSAPAPRPRPPRPSAAARPRPTPAPPVAPAEAPAPGYFLVDSRPYARIYIDDRDKGETPLFRVELPPGRHRVRAVLPDGRRQQFTITIESGRELSAGRLKW